MPNDFAANALYSPSGVLLNLSMWSSGFLLNLNMWSSPLGFLFPYRIPILLPNLSCVNKDNSVTVHLIVIDFNNTDSCGYSDNFLQWQLMQSAIVLFYSQNDMYRVNVGYSDTFASLRGCHCNRSRLYGTCNCVLCHFEWVPLPELRIVRDSDLSDPCRPRIYLLHYIFLVKAQHVFISLRIIPQHNFHIVSYFLHVLMVDHFREKDYRTLFLCKSKQQLVKGCPRSTMRKRRYVQKM